MRDEYGASQVLPGITGLAQVHGRDEISDENKAAYDGKYALNVGFFWMFLYFLKQYQMLFTVGVSMKVKDNNGELRCIIISKKY